MLDHGIDIDHGHCLGHGCSIDHGHNTDMGAAERHQHPDSQRKSNLKRGKARPLG